MADKLFMLFDEYADKFDNIPSLPLMYFGHFMIVTLKLRNKIGEKMLECQNYFDKCTANISLAEYEYFQYLVWLLFFNINAKSSV